MKPRITTNEGPGWDLNISFLSVTVEIQLQDDYLAEVVGSNPTRSTFIILVDYGIVSSSI
jgi:hypothetical protein